MTLKNDNKAFKLHVAMIAAQEGVTPAKATFQAWLEGFAGLKKRLGQPELPLETEQKQQAEKTPSK